MTRGTGHEGAFTKFGRVYIIVNFDANGNRLVWAWAWAFHSLILPLHFTSDIRHSHHGSEQVETYSVICPSQPEAKHSPFKTRRGTHAVVISGALPYSR